LAAQGQVASYRDFPDADGFHTRPGQAWRWVSETWSPPIDTAGTDVLSSGDYRQISTAEAERIIAASRAAGRLVDGDGGCVQTGWGFPSESQRDHNGITNLKPVKTKTSLELR